MFAFLSQLVALNYFTEIHMNFLPPGHTHSNLDQKYSVISQRLRGKDIFLLQDVVEEVSDLFEGMGDLTRQVEVPATADFPSFFKGRTHKLVGHGTTKINGVNRRLHSFRFKRGQDGMPGVTYKEHDEVGPWSYRWDKPAEQIQVLKESPVDAELKAGPRRRVRLADCLLANFPTNCKFPTNLLQIYRSTTWTS
jgi:hypothetical protein